MEIHEITEKLERLEIQKTEKAKLEGEFESYKKRLKEKFNCKNSEEARLRKEKLIKERDALTEKINRKLQEFEEKYGDGLQD